MNNLAPMSNCPGVQGRIIFVFTKFNVYKRIVGKSEATIACTP